MNHASYVKAYPAYCRTCKGWGLHIPSSPDGTMWECGCVVARQCPRCGARDTLSDNRHCSNCQWDILDPRRGLPGTEVIFHGAA